MLHKFIEIHACGFFLWKFVVNLNHGQFVKKKWGQVQRAHVYSYAGHWSLYYVDE
jgi:hypothetical protein